MQGLLCCAVSVVMYASAGHVTVSAAARWSLVFELLLTLVSVPYSSTSKPKIKPFIRGGQVNARFPMQPDIKKNDFILYYHFCS